MIFLRRAKKYIVKKVCYAEEHYMNIMNDLIFYSGYRRSIEFGYKNYNMNLSLANDILYFCIKIKRNGNIVYDFCIKFPCNINITRKMNIVKLIYSIPIGTIKIIKSGTKIKFDTIKFRNGFLTYKLKTIIYKRIKI